MLNSENIYLRGFILLDAEKLLQLQIENKDFFKQYSMNRPTNIFIL